MIRKFSRSGTAGPRASARETMIFLEFALRGIRKFCKATFFRFRPGLNLIQGENGSGKTTLRDTLFLVFSEFPAPTTLLSPGEIAEPHCQAAVTLQTSNGEILRLAKDFGKNVAVLYRYAPETQQFAAIEKRKHEIYRWLREQWGGLDQSQLLHYFSLDRTRLPSVMLNGERLHPGAQQTDLIPGLGTPLADPSASQDKRRRLEELRAMAEQAEQVFQLEEQLADAQNRLAGLKRKLDSLSQVEQDLQELESKIKVFSELGLSLEHLQELTEGFGRRLVEKNRELENLTQECEILEHQLNLISTDPVYKTKLFLSGGLLTGVSIGTGLLFPLPGIFQHLYLAGLALGIGLLTVALGADIRRQSRRKRLEDKLQNKLKNIELLDARFKRENADFFEILRKTQTGSLDAFKERLNAYNLLSTSHQRLTEEKARILQGKEAAALQMELQAETLRIDQMKNRLKAFEGTPSDLPSIREEIELLEKETNIPKIDITREAPRKLDAWLQSLRPLIQQPAIGDTRDLVGDAGRILQRLSLGFYTGLSINGSNGQLHIKVLARASSDPIPVEKLSAGTLDQLFLSIYCAFIQRLGSRLPFPILLDDPFLTLDPRRQETAVEVFREISRQRQVLLFSNHPYAVKNGETCIRLE